MYIILWKSNLLLYMNKLKANFYNSIKMHNNVLNVYNLYHTVLNMSYTYLTES